MLILALTALVSAASGVVLLVGGINLLTLGGSPYYAIAGAVFVIVAALLVLRRREALALYGLFTLGSLAWAVWEVGFDWWQLGPRAASSSSSVSGF